MKQAESGDVTRLLAAWSNGSEAALDELTPIVHRELHKLAAAQLRGERPNHTLQASALVNEAFLRFVQLNRTKWETRGQFYAFAATTMRRVRTDYARGRGTQKEEAILRRLR